MTASFGDIIRRWRAIRRYSQLDLSLEAEISARHLSFLESGRANPSRAMVLTLSSALAMPRSAANLAMRAAGFAPAFPQLADDAPDLAPVRAAVDMTLDNHAPLPAVAIDREWNVLSANAPMTSLFAAIGADGLTNMLDALIALGETDIIENWEETALLALVRLRAEIDETGGDTTLEKQARLLAASPRLESHDLGAVNLNQAVIPSVFLIGGERLAMFSAIAQFGTVQDVAASEIRLEMFFPADAATRRYFEDATAA